MTNTVLTLLVTAYIWTGRTCANNHYPVSDVSCAAPRSVPLGTWLYIEGIGYRRVDDRYRYDLSDRIDLYYGRSRARALDWGVKSLKVWIVKNPHDNNARSNSSPVKGRGR